MIDPVQARSFLEQGRIAVVGASDEKGNFGRTICQSLREHDCEVVAVHPSATTAGGAPAYASVRLVPAPVDTAIVMVPARESASVVRDCVAAGVRRIWLFKGFGPGALSDEAVQVCREAGVEVIAGACPLMFLEPVRGVHRFHRGLRRLNHSVGGAHAA